MKWYARISPARLLTADWRYVSTQFFPVGAREYVLAIDMPPKLWYATQFCTMLLRGEYTIIEGERSTRASHVFACELIRGVAALLFTDGSRRKAFLRRSSADGGRIDLSLFKVYAARRSLCYGLSECHPAPRTWRVILEALQRAYPSFFVTLPV